MIQSITLKRALQFTLSYEGGYANDPDDSGLETYRGISRKWHADCPIWAEIDKRKNPGNPSGTNNYIPKNTIFDDLEPAVEAFYTAEYWVKNKLNEIKHDRLAIFMFDFAVHSGSRVAIKKLQAILKTGADGSIGNHTLKAIEICDINVLIKQLHAERIAYLRSLKQPKFIKGWENRVNDLYKICK